MPYNSPCHHRRSIRLKRFDYAQEGMYFVTLTTRHRAPLFGAINQGSTHLSDFGRIVQEEWLRTPTVRPDVSLDEFVIMPDHMHGIIKINDERNGGSEPLKRLVGANSNSPQRVTPFRSPSRTLGAIVRGFKGASTKRINALRGTPGAPVWQRNYYEHIIRDGNDLDRIRSYIEHNAAARAEQQELENESMNRDDIDATGQTVGSRHAVPRQLH